MSQGPQGSFGPDRLTLPLSKFSYATVHGESITPIPWIHLGRANNLFAIFETQCTDDGGGQLRDFRKFRVLQDPQVLEDIDLDVLASEATRAKIDAQHPTMTGKVPSVTVIIKRPCIAIRYPLQGGQIRRIQLRLANDEDYFEILKIFTRSNVPFADAGTFPTTLPQARPFSSSSSLLRPSDSMSQIGVRPASVSLNIGDLGGAAASATMRSTSSMRPITSHSRPLGSPYGTSSDYFAQASHRRYRTEAQSGLELQEHMTDLEKNPDISHQGPPLNSPSDGLRSEYFASSTSAPAIPLSASSALGIMPSHRSIDLYQQRPSTAPFIKSQSLSQMLPPKRELPFASRIASKKAKKGSTEGPSKEPKVAPPSLPLVSRDRKNSMSDAVHALEATSQISPEFAVTVPATKMERATALKKAKPRAPKKQQAKVPPKKPSPTFRENVVPSIEQLLQTSPFTTSQPIEASTITDTQALLSKAEATRPHTSNDQLVLSERQAAQSDMSASKSQKPKCDSCRLRKGKCGGGNPCDWCREVRGECTYGGASLTDHLIQVLSSQPEAAALMQTGINHVTETVQNAACQTVASPTDATSKMKSAPDHQAIQQALPPTSNAPKTPEPRRINPDTTLMGNAPTTPTTSRKAADSIYLSASSHPLALLLREPEFDQSDRIGSWASLPESVQHSTLDTWMCQQLGDPAFIELVKRIDESWQAQLVGRSVGVDS